MLKKAPPIGNDLFNVVRENGYYYIDKSLMIKDFVEFRDTAALITRPRRFGKTLNITMLREFFDITKDSRAIFNGLAIMDTEYAKLINSRPVIYLSFKDCKADSQESLIFAINTVVLEEYDKHYNAMKITRENPADTNKNNYTYDGYYDFILIYNKLKNRELDKNYLSISIKALEKTLAYHYKIKPVVLIDEYDQPILSSYEYGYYNKLTTFFSGFYGAALKGQEHMHQALLTGIQRVVKESVFSQLNNIRLYTVLDEGYSGYFGLTSSEAENLLNYYGLRLDEPVTQKYDGYTIGNNELYNPWSLLNYAGTGKLDNYWINTSTNFLIKKSIDGADDFFHDNFNRLISDGSVRVGADIGSSFIELKNNSTLWGLLINAGYVTVTGRTGEYLMDIRIPNGEVGSEFIKIIAGRANLQDADLRIMFDCLINKDIDGFINIYRQLVVSCTSYFDAKENAYHMLFLGMCITLRHIYKINSNIEAGHGRSDIILESSSPERPHIIIEFKQGENIDGLKHTALRQIIENKYNTGLHGDVLCIGIAHDKKRCAAVHELIKAN